MTHRAQDLASTVVVAASKVWKAIFAGATQLIGGLILVTVDGGTLGDVSTNQWLVIGSAVLLSVGGVWGITNKT